MKGSLHTDELMGAVVSRQAGIRTARRISHCFIMDVPNHPDALIITDAAVNIAPTLDDKVDIVQNAIDLAHAMGVAEVRVAILSAMETVNAKVPSTIEAAALCKMADRGQITGALLDGPLALDNAISPRGGGDQADRFAGGGACQRPGGAGSRGRQHAGQEPVVPGASRRRGHRARRARADHPDQPRRFAADAPRVVRGCGHGRRGAPQICSRIHPLKETPMSDGNIRQVLAGQKALVVGVANDQSIAYGCAKAFRTVGADAGDHLAERTGPALCRAAGAGTRRADHRRAGRVGPRPAGGDLRSHSFGMGQAGHPGALDRLCTEGRSARRAAELLGRRLRARRWTSRAIRSSAWRSWRRR